MSAAMSALIDVENKMPDKENDEAEENDTAEEPCSKKAKIVSWKQEDELESTIENVGLVASKESDEKNRLILKANESMKLVFVDCKPDGSFVFHSFPPEFTHQLFENEQITLPDAFIDAVPSIMEGQTTTQTTHLLSVYIRCADLAHCVIIDNNVLLPSGNDFTNTVLNQLQNGLPSSPEDVDGLTILHGETLPSTFLDSNIFQYKNYEENKDLGRLLSSWMINGDGSVPSSRLELYLANNKDVPSSGVFLRRAEKVAMWHIETADAVDYADEHWEVATLYRCQDVSNDNNNSCVRSVVGYMTLYTFLNPFKGAKLRVCQALILPHEQKKGLGRDMLLSIYRLAVERPDVVEITVEDPSPGFEHMRDTVDCEWLLITMQTVVDCSKVANGNDQSLYDKIGQWLTSLTPQDKIGYLKKLKLKPSQFHFAFDAIQYALLHHQQSSISQLELKQPSQPQPQQEEKEKEEKEEEEEEEDAMDIAWKKFRLQVKRRLLGENAYIKKFEKEQLQKELEILYDESHQRFEKCSKHCLRVIASIGDMI